MPCPNCGECVTSNAATLKHHENNCSRSLQNAQNPPAQAIQPPGKPILSCSLLVSLANLLFQAAQPTEIEDYCRKAADALDASKTMISDLCKKAAPNQEAQETRAMKDFPKIKNLLADVTVGRVLSAEQALQQNPADRPTDAIILCNTNGASHLFADRAPTIPVVIRQYQQAGLTIDDLLSLLLTRIDLDIHDFGVDQEQGYIPILIPSAEAIKTFQERRHGHSYPYNLLNLGQVKDNMVPTFIANRRD
jgi:hypothetical protein